MIETLIAFVLLILSLLLVFKSSDYSIRYSTKVAKSFLLPQYVIGFLVVAVMGVLPEGLIAVSSALNGLPGFGLGTLFGSNTADITLIFAVIILASGRDLTVTSRLIQNAPVYIGAMATPIIFGLNGHYSRFEGFALILIGLLFYLFILRKSGAAGKAKAERFSGRDVVFLAVSMAALLLGAHYTVKFGVNFAENLNIDPLVIGMFVVGLGTTIPELFFSLRALRHHRDALALGDILGTVMTDATIVVGIVAAIAPFSFDPRIIYVTGVAMFFSLVTLFYFMKTGKKITKKEALLLLLFYLLFVSAEIYVSRL